MKLYNEIPLLLECLERWQTRPTPTQFQLEYAQPLARVTGNFFDDFYEVLFDLDWPKYREHTLKMDANREQQRVTQCLDAVQDCFGVKLEGDILMLGTFHTMDGYSRFDRGSHRVYLGLDEDFDTGRYIEMLTVHEFTHVARESRPEVWAGFGLDVNMTQDEFTENLPSIEHLVGEGFSCAISESLVPGEPKWRYGYQTEAGLEKVFKNSEKLDRFIHEELKRKDGDYGRFYGLRPIFSHYVWGWQWVKAALRDLAQDDPKKFLTLCSKDFLDHALQFKLTRF